MKTPCPYCKKPLRSPNAEQCFHCGWDWHDLENPIQHPSSEPSLDELYPMRWWHWVTMPFNTLIALALIPIALAVYFPIAATKSLRMWARERRIKNQAKQNDRFMPESTLVNRLSEGNGTLIIVWESAPKGSLFEWWTEDDVIGDLPIQLPNHLADAFEAEDSFEFAQQCFDRYCDLKTGAAMLTDGLDFETAIKFSRKFPSANALTLYTSTRSGPYIVSGHALDNAST